MTIRLALVAASCMLVLPAIASSGYTPAVGEASFRTHPMPSTTTRQQVQQELEAWRRNPVSADGWRDVGGEVGWVFVSTPGRKTRAEVLAELARWRANPVSEDGWAQRPGEVGWVFVGRDVQSQASAGGSREAKSQPATHHESMAKK
jgi:hypothetical protein